MRRDQLGRPCANHPVGPGGPGGPGLGLAAAARARLLPGSGGRAVTYSTLDFADVDAADSPVRVWVLGFRV